MTTIKRLLFRVLYKKELDDLIGFRGDVAEKIFKGKKPFDYYMGKKSAIEAIIYNLSGLNY